jgi:hypothetical protein
VISDVISLERATQFIPKMIHRTVGREYLKVAIDITMADLEREADVTTTLAQLPEGLGY